MKSPKSPKVSPLPPVGAAFQEQEEAATAPESGAPSEDLAEAFDFLFFVTSEEQTEKELELDKLDVETEDSKGCMSCNEGVTPLEVKEFLRLTKNNQSN